MTSAPASEGTFDRGLRAQAAVIKALILREFSGQYSRENIGYLWIVGEPMLLASVVTLIHLGQTNHFSSDIGVAPFAIIGYTVFIIFRGIVNRAEAIIDRNTEVFYHRRVAIIDILIARAVIETVGCVTTTIILMSIAISVDLASLPARPLYLVSAIAMMVWWSFAISLVVACVTYKNETMGRQVHVVTYFCIPLSGAFWQLSQTPSAIANVLQWFPMTLIFEQARYGQFEFAPSRYVAPAYVCAVCAAITYAGLLLTRRLRSRL